MGVGSGIDDARCIRHHRMGHLGKIGARPVAFGARALGASVDLHYLSAPVQVLHDRLQRTAAEDPPIERGSLVKWAEVFQAPSREEMAPLDASVTISA